MVWRCIAGGAKQKLPFARRPVLLRAYTCPATSALCPSSVCPRSWERKEGAVRVVEVRRRQSTEVGVVNSRHAGPGRKACCNRRRPVCWRDAGRRVGRRPREAGSGAQKKRWRACWGGSGGSRHGRRDTGCWQKCLHVQNARRTQGDGRERRSPAAVFAPASWRQHARGSRHEDNGVE